MKRSEFIITLLGGAAVSGCYAARVAGRPAGGDHGDLTTNQIGRQRWQARFAAYLLI